MKIAIDARAVTDEASGVGVYTRTLIRGLAGRDDGDQYHLVSNRRVHLPADLPENFRILQEPHHIGNFWLQWQCPGLLRREGVEVFHGTNFLAPLRSPCPTVLTVHDLSSLLFPRLHTRRNNLVQRLLPRAVKRARLVIAISENTKRDLIEHLRVPPEKIRLVYNAPAENFGPAVDEAYQQAVIKRLSLPERYFLFVGTLEPRKNVTRLLEAFARYSRLHENGTKLLLVGSEGWGSRDVRKTHRQLGLGERVRFVGYVDHADLPAVYRQAKALVMPSVYEGFGLPIVEAMACGTPVIAAANSALAEVAGDAAVLIDPDDAAGLAESLIALSSDERVRERCVQAGLAQAGRFSLAAFAEATHRVYREALEDGR
ncbi:MAG: glycosyltransferase family 4 protein [Alphaproteobacteria bacterium]